MDPDAKKAVVSKVNDCFDVDMTATSPIEYDLFGNEPAPQPQDPTFTVDQLEAMLAQARAQQAGNQLLVRFLDRHRVPVRRG